MFELPKKKFAQLKPVEQQFVRKILIGQPGTQFAIRAGLTDDALEATLGLLIGLIDNGMAQIVLYGDDTYHLELDPGVSDAIKREYGAFHA